MKVGWHAAQRRVDEGDTSQVGLQPVKTGMEELNGSKGRSVTSGGALALDGAWTELGIWGRLRGLLFLEIW